MHSQTTRRESLHNKDTQRQWLPRLVDADVQRRDGRESLRIRTLGGRLYLNKLAKRRQFRFLRRLRRVRSVGRALLTGSVGESVGERDRDPEGHSRKETRAIGGFAD